DPENRTFEFRPNEGVDIEKAGNSDNNYNISYTATGEWLNYSVRVEQSGTYKVRFQIASAEGKGGWQLSLNSQLLEGTRLNAVNTGGWQAYTLVFAEQTVYLPKGDHVLRLTINEGDFNLDYFEFELDKITGINSGMNSRVSVYPIPA